MVFQRVRYKGIQSDEWFRVGYVRVNPFTEEEANLDDIDAVFSDSVVRKGEEGDGTSMCGGENPIGPIGFVTSTFIFCVNLSSFLVSFLLFLILGVPMYILFLKKIVFHFSPSHCLICDTQTT